MTKSTFALVAPLIIAAAARADDRWIRVTSPHFELYTPAGAGAAKAAIKHFEQVYGFFEKTLAGVPPAGKRVRIIGFNREKDFREFEKYGWADAFYLPGNDRDYIVMKSLVESAYAIAIHEYVHLLARRGGLKLPAWLSEGFADFFTTLRPMGKKIRIGEFEPGRYRQLMTNKWLPFEELTGASRESAYRNEKNRVGVFYAQSWALTHMVLMEDDYSPKWGEFLKAIQEKPADEVFNTLYGKPLSGVEKDLRGYMNSGSYKVIIVDMKLEKLAEAPEVAGISEPEANLVLARVLTNSGRAADARPILEEVARSPALAAEAHELLGYLDLYANHDDAAIAHFQKAVAAGQPSASVHRDLGMLLWRQQKHDEASASLQKFIDLQPAEIDVRLQLASLLMRNEKHGAALSVLVQARQVPAAKAYRFYHALAYAYIRLAAWDQARKAAESAGKYAKNPDDTAEARRLLTYLEKRDEYEKVAARHPAVPPALAANLPADEAEAAPKIRRKPLSAEEINEEGILETVPPKELAVAEGAFEGLECREGGARVHVKTAAGTVVLAIDDPSRVNIVGKDAGTIDLQCGAQAGSPAVRAGYLAGSAAEGVAGILRRLEFQ
ncbi:MAG: hypothetical protein R2729_31965 [Bryobacteraceae bacterium]